jgi:hypothetical protein
MFCKIVLVSLLVACTLCALGVDVSQLYSTSVYQCIKNSGYSFLVIRGYCSYGAVDSHIL